MSTISKFENEKQFKNEFKFLGRYSTGYPNEYEYIDLSYDKTLYGKIDSEGDAVALKDNNVLLLEGGRSDVWAVKPVADAFREFRKYMAQAAYYNKIATNIASHYTSLTPIKGWESLTNLYNIHMNELYENFVGSYMKKRSRSKRITNFKNFMQVFMEYVEQLSPDIPFTKTAFVNSKKCPPHVSGLIIELSNLSRNDHTRRDMAYDDPNYNFFRNTARKFGFYVDKNAPWTLVANLNSGYTYKVKPFASQKNFPDTEAESGMAPYLKKYVSPGLTIHEQFYYKTCLGDEWDSLNGGDMILLRHYLFQFYTSLAAASPFILHNADDKASISGLGPGMRIRHSSKSNPMIKFFREDLGQIDEYGGMPDEYIEKYGPKFWLMINMRIRFAESNMKINLQKEYHDVIKIMRNESLVHAMEYINNRTRGHERTKFNILGGKKWHDKNPPPEKDTIKRMKIISPTGKVTETGSPIQTIESTAASVSAIISSGGTSNAGGGSGY